MNKPALPFSVASVDNYNPPWAGEDGDPPLEHGSFATAREAIAKARFIVDESLMSLHEPGQTYEELLGSFRSFGEAPMVFGPGHPIFDTYAYVKQQCALITALSAAEAH